MTGLMIQQVNVQEIEALFRSIVREELQLLSTSVISPIGRDPTPTVFLNKEQAAKVLGISIPTFSLMIKEGSIKGYKIGNRYKFKENELLDAVALKRNKNN
ncbi:MAG: helix-turn-helix domain-containing protein [Sphingobacteriia bacterium]|jgi:excisionase family DNA binding protein